MKTFQKVSVITATIISTFILASWTIETLGPVVARGCQDTTRSFGWPAVFFVTTGSICGDPVPMYFNVFMLLADLLVIGTILYWVYLLVKVVRKELYDRQSP